MKFKILITLRRNQSKNEFKKKIFIFDFLNTK